VLEEPVGDEPVSLFVPVDVARDVITVEDLVGRGGADEAREVIDQAGAVGGGPLAPERDLLRLQVVVADLVGPGIYRHRQADPIRQATAQPAKRGGLAANRAAIVAVEKAHQPCASVVRLLDAATGKIIWARDVAHESMVLLKNAGATLPLNKASVQSVAVIGRTAGAPSIVYRTKHELSRNSPILS
jgi:hypothetical protein